ncbi:TIGR01777 family oxidoreductase [Sedimenticola selenatireducens]|uniref:TIGR01777 family protein n=1 Tax=Sedimenticola selenatireducens TaxID=191960 RepID=A0A558DWD4_9GAMM|nr:TIGR01777 family oxidoreductase [Sedimenticola selenatireducens]TVO77913.1 TIGR01777 family protein [Sedimenticola selenatireducens]TVT65218.1 MAG: TIGR01777 family protein [Sedimenticola selenatireducens]
MKIAITGATGFIGQHLTRAFKSEGYHMIQIGRNDFAQGTDYLVDKIRGVQVLINLAGAPINRRWTAAYKREISASRVETTKQLVDAIETLSHEPGKPVPEQFISTSAIGAFDCEGHYTEADTPNANDFLGEVSKQWEAEAKRAITFGVPTNIFRFGLVLGQDGGLMKQLMLPFKLGLGGPLGDGQQHFSWIHIDDLVGAYFFIIKHQPNADMFHLCAPNPVTNERFTQTLGKALHRSTRFRVPGLFLKLVYGKGSEVMLSGQSVTSSRLTESGFCFRYPDITSAICALVDESAHPRTEADLDRSIQRHG